MKRLPEYHVVAAGSILRLKTVQERGFPVGKVNFLNLYPLIFFEFLSAINHEKIRTFLEEIKTFDPLLSSLHDKLVQLLKLYFFIGGMPESVLEYVKHEQLQVVIDVQLEILNSL